MSHSHSKRKFIKEISSYLLSRPIFVAVRLRVALWVRVRVALWVRVRVALWVRVRVRVIVRVRVTVRVRFRVILVISYLGTNSLILLLLNIS